MLTKDQNPKILRFFPFHDYNGEVTKKESINACIKPWLNSTVFESSNLNVKTNANDSNSTSGVLLRVFALLKRDSKFAFKSWNRLLISGESNNKTKWKNPSSIPSTLKSRVSSTILCKISWGPSHFEVEEIVIEVKVQQVGWSTSKRCPMTLDDNEPCHRVPIIKLWGHNIDLHSSFLDPG